MLIGNVTINGDINCRVKVFKCDDNSTWDCGGKLIYDSYEDCFEDVDIREMEVTYITIFNGELILEVW